jgi:molybdopterin-synthase adenylyltransferase
MDATARADHRYDRQLELFGREGQDRLEAARVAVLGVGGLGSHACQQLAYLGVRSFLLVDDDDVEDTNLNRLIGASSEDIGTSKLDIAIRMITAVQPQSNIVRVDAKLPDVRVDSALDDVDLIMGCFDNDYPRLLTTALASERKTVYIDVASGIDVESLFYGGRVLVAGESAGCLHCLGELDQNEIRRAQLTGEQLQVEADIYGVPIEKLSGTGPAVVTLSGVVASIATTEAMAVLTGLRRGHKLQKYLANFGVVRQSGAAPSLDCFYCAQWAS